MVCDSSFFSSLSTVLIRNVGWYTKDKTSGAAGKLDVAIIEATSITEDGNIILGASVGATPEILQMSDKVIIEVLQHTKIQSKLNRV